MQDAIRAYNEDLSTESEGSETHEDASELVSTRL